MAAASHFLDERIQFGAVFCGLGIRKKIWHQQDAFILDERLETVRDCSFDKHQFIDSDLEFALCC